MHLPQPLRRSQIPLFEPFLATATLPGAAPEQKQLPEQYFSELSLSAARGNRLQLLGAILRDLSQSDDHRWLSLVAPPAAITHEWLRRAGIHRERVLLLHPRAHQSELELACEALRLGRSHTVISWLALAQNNRQRLLCSAAEGRSHCLNIALNGSVGGR